MPRTALIKPRQGTAAAWTSANPILAAGEEGLESDTGLRKLGDGTTAWTSLTYKVPALGSAAAITATWTFTAAPRVAGIKIDTGETLVAAHAAQERLHMGTGAGFSATSASLRCVDFGPSAGYSNNAGTDNTNVGRTASLLNVSGSNRTCLGRSAAQNNLASDITATGANCLSGATGATGTAIAAYGDSTGVSVSTASYLALFGSGCATSLTTGSYHDASGFHALLQCVTGEGDTVHGYGCGRSILGDYYDASGMRAAYYCRSGTGETWHGCEAGWNNQDGLYSAGVGYRAGTAGAAYAANMDTAGTLPQPNHRCSWMGANTGRDTGVATTITNSGAWGYGAVVSISNAYCVGVAGDKLGVGVKSPLAALDVRSSVSAARVMLDDADPATPGFFSGINFAGTAFSGTNHAMRGNAGDTYLNAPTGTVRFQVANVEHSRFTSTGALGLGATSPGARLHIEWAALVNTTIGLIVKGRGGQVGDLQQWKDSGDNVLRAITAAGLVQWKAAASVQTTVGAAGPASALPATPSKYLKVVGDDGVTYVVPAYAAA